MGSYKVSFVLQLPRSSNTAVIGLLKNDRVINMSAHLCIAWEFISWHRSHERMVAKSAVLDDKNMKEIDMILKEAENYYKKREML